LLDLLHSSWCRNGGGATSEQPSAVVLPSRQRNLRAARRNQVAPTCAQQHGAREPRTAVGKHSAVDLAPSLRGLGTLGDGVLSHGRSRGSDRGETGGLKPSRR